MSISYYKCAVVFSYCLAIAFRNNCLIYSVDNSLAVLHLVKVCPCVSPTVICAENLCIHTCSVSVNCCAHACRSDSILIVFISPRLNNRNTGLTGCVVVNDIDTVRCNLVTLYLVLCYGILDLATVLILRKILPCICPVILLCYSLAILNSTVCKKVNRDTCRSLSILVICIIPSLCTCDSYSLRSMLIGNSKSVYSRLITCGNLCLHNCVDKVFSFSVLLGKCCKCMCPVVR